MLETILFVSVVIAVGAFVAMRAKLKNKNEKQSNNIADITADKDTNQSVPQPVAQPVTGTQPELTDSEREKIMRRNLSLAGVDYPETQDSVSVPETTIAAETANDTIVEPNKTPKAPRKTTRARKK